jgi:hypothetical protein
MDRNQANERLRKELLINSYDMYYAHEIRGLYVSTEVSAHKGHVMVMTKRLGGSGLQTIWDSDDRPQVVSNRVVDMLRRPGTRVPGVLVANKEVEQPLQIRSEPDAGVGTAIDVDAFAGDPNDDSDLSEPNDEHMKKRAELARQKELAYEVSLGGKIRTNSVSSPAYSPAEVFVYVPEYRGGNGKLLVDPST